MSHTGNTELFVSTEVFDGPIKDEVVRSLRKRAASKPPIKLFCLWEPDSAASEENQVIYDLSTSYAQEHLASILILARTARRIILKEESNSAES